MLKQAQTVLSHVFHAVVFNTISPSQGYALGAASGGRKGKQNPPSKDRERGEEPPSPWFQLQGQFAVMSLWPNIAALMTDSYNLICNPLLQWALRGQQAVLLAWRGLFWQPSGALDARQQYRHMQEKTQLKTVMSQISDNFFHQEPWDPNHQFIQSQRLGIGSLRAFICVLMWFNKDDPLAYSSGTNT